VRPPKLFVDASALYRAIHRPRLAFEILNLALRGEVQLLASSLVLEETKDALQERAPELVWLFDLLITLLPLEMVPDASHEAVDGHAGLCRDEADIPLILAAAAARVDYLMTADNDLNDEDESTTELRKMVSPISPLAFLRYIMKWPEDRIVPILSRTWRDLDVEDDASFRQLLVDNGYGPLL